MVTTGFYLQFNAPMRKPIPATTGGPGQIMGMPQVPLFLLTKPIEAFFLSELLQIY